MLKEIKEHSFYDEKLNSEITVIDLGACKGEFINELALHYNIKKAILVEASPINFIYLQNKENYVLYNNAVSDTNDEEISFYVDTNSPYNGSEIFNYFQGEEYKIKTINLSKLISDNNLDEIDILKIDIEGSEYKIFNTVSDDELLKIKQITIEFHDFIDTSLKFKTQEILKRFETLGFSKFAKGIDYMHGSENYDVLLYR